MKKILILVLIGIVCFSLAGCSNDSVEIGDESEYMVSDNLLTLKAKESSLTKSSVSLILENHTNDNYIYGNSYSIEYQKEGIWYEIIPNSKMDFNMIGYILNSKDSKEIIINWEKLYGKLSSGKYRIIKEVYIESEQLEEPIDIYNFETSEIIYISEEFTVK